MAKAYTAQEMRNCADNCDGRINPCIAEMLRQAADSLEREEKREKKYEYGYRDKMNYVPSCHFKTEDLARMCAINNTTIVRREVGEWEEVRDAN